jgi:hypothetical protein
MASYLNFSNKRAMVTYQNQLFDLFEKRCLPILRTMLMTVRVLFLFLTTSQQWLAYMPKRKCPTQQSVWILLLDILIQCKYMQLRKNLSLSKCDLSHGLTIYYSEHSQTHVEYLTVVRVLGFTLALAQIQIETWTLL